MNELSGLTQEITHQKAISVKMKALCLVVVLLALPVLRSESHPRHRNSTNLETQVRTPLDRSYSTRLKILTFITITLVPKSIM